MQYCVIGFFSTLCYSQAIKGLNATAGGSAVLKVSAITVLCSVFSDVVHMQPCPRVLICPLR